MNVGGHDMQKPDGVLFEKIMSALEDRVIELDELLYTHTKKKEEPSEIEEKQGDVEAVDGFQQIEGNFFPVKKTAEIEPLLRSVLFCGICELLVHTDIDHPIIINDYLHITHAFYEQQQVSFVNGVLDSIASLLRSGEPV
jgi:hypothetical protein